MEGKGAGTVAISVLLQVDCTLLPGLAVTHVKTTLVPQSLRACCACPCSWAFLPTDVLFGEKAFQEGSPLPVKPSLDKKEGKRENEDAELNVTRVQKQ